LEAAWGIRERQAPRIPTTPAAAAAILAPRRISVAAVISAAVAVATLVAVGAAAAMAVAQVGTSRTSFVLSIIMRKGGGGSPSH
jgi:hypothetical protein